MDIHIICCDLHEDKILPRLARTLADGRGWTLSEQPRKDADLNYFQSYITWSERNSDFHSTPIVAYFSHYEPQTAFKRTWWENAARSIDGAILTAAQYGRALPEQLPKFVVRPPIHPSFTYEVQLSGRAKPRVGFSGYVDRSGRKGEWIADQLQKDLGDDIEFVACGSGWPIPTQLYPFEDLSTFYRSLDVFICASNLEGIPMPPLEAIACGVRTLVPRGVGILDELPESSDIIHYTASDYAELKDKLQEALFDNAPRDHIAMREAIAIYTPDSWCIDHENAFREILSKDPVSVSVESDRHGRRGVFYVAYGEPARRCAEGAIQSFKACMSGTPVALASDQPLGPEDIFIQHPDEDIGGRSVKTQIYDLAPREWEYVMYLDADTEITADISFLFRLLESGWDMVICKNPGKYHTIRYMERSDNKDECEYTYALLGTDQLIQLNGGVFTFQRNPRTEAFFRAWHEEWKRWGKRDQAALLRALFAHPLKLCVLTNAWNTITRYESPESSAGILHYPMTARRWRGIVDARLDSAEAWSQVEKFSQPEIRE